MKFFCDKCQKIVVVNEIDAKTASCPDCQAEFAVPENFPGPGVVVGDFLIEKELSHGGMGQVFVARQISLDRQVALKVLQNEHAGDSEYVDSLFREARAAAKINHPNIVQAYAVGEDDGIFYFAMELVRGETMKAILKEQGIPPFVRSVKVIRDIAMALDTAWREQKLVHQDIKPENIMIDKASGMAKLADLGLAKTASADIPDDDEDEVMGTPQYISPEQLTGVPTDVRSDMYSLGATFFQFVTGRFPYVAPTAEELAHMHNDGNLEPPHMVNPEVPEELSRIIVKMMARNIEHRYQTPAELIADLDAFLDNGGAEKSTSKTVALAVALVVAVVVAGIIGAGVLGFFWWQKKQTASDGVAIAPTTAQKVEPVEKAVLPPTPEKVLPPPPPPIRKEYQSAVDKSLKIAAKNLEAVDQLWKIVSTPQNSSEKALLDKNLPVFVTADENRCDADRDVLRRAHIQARSAEYSAAETAEREKLLEKRRKEEFEKNIKIAKEREQRSRQLAEKQRKAMLADLDAQMAARFVPCIIGAFNAAAGRGEDEFQQNMNSFNAFVRNYSADDEKAVAAKYVSIASEFPEQIKRLKKQFIQMQSAGNYSDDAVFFGSGDNNIHVSGINQTGVITREKGEIKWSKLRAGERRMIISSLRQCFPGAEFYLPAYFGEMPELKSAKKIPADRKFWSRCLTAAKIK